GGVQQGVERLPSGRGEVGGAAGVGVGRAALGAPAPLFGMRQVAEVVDGHQGVRQCELVVAGGGGGGAGRGCRGVGGGAGGGGERPAGCWGARTGWGQRWRWRVWATQRMVSIGLGAR